MADFLKVHYEVTIAHPLEAEKYENTADIILIRNIWPAEEYFQEYRGMYGRFIKKGLKVYNPYLGLGDMRGKEYLARLWKDNYPVIPTVTSIGAFRVLPHTKEYLLKPLYGGSSTGIQKLRKEQLERLENIDGHILQPLLKLKQEVSFYYIDGELQFALATEAQGDRWNLHPFEATDVQKQIAQKFVDWNTLPYGIQRIDFCVTESGDFLLMEIEDWCPYLSLLDIDQNITNRFLDRLVFALKNLDLDTP